MTTLDRIQATVRRSRAVGAITAVLALATGCADVDDVMARSHLPLDWRAVESSSTRTVVDTVVAAAEESVREGRPWRATQMLAPVLQDPSRRTPDAIMVAARAATAWGGWLEVVRLLRDERWLDSAFAGEGHALLSRAALEADQRALDSMAVRHGRRAVDAAADSAVRGERLVALARALERVGRTDESRDTWQRASELMPAIGDWLLLRAAALEPSGTARLALFSRVRVDAARSRQPWIDAAARERFGDLAGAADVLDSLGAHVEALRVKLSMDATESARVPIRRALVRVVESQRGSASARRATEILIDTFTRLTPGEQLAIARSAASTGPASRAAAGFAAAFAGGLGTAHDRYTYGRVLEQLGRHDSAIEQFGRASRTSALAGRAGYQRARSLLRAGRLAESRSALREVVRQRGDPASSASALFLLADLATDEQRDDAARAAFLELVRRFPGSSLAPRAAMRAAILAFAHDSVTRAARELDVLRARYATSGEAIAATYWAGRAWASAGDTTRAEARWRLVLEREPRGYYAMLARARLERPFAMPPNGVAVARSAAVDSAIARAALLDRLGLDREAQREYDRIERDAGRSASAARAAGLAFQRHGLGPRTIRLGAQAVRRTPEPDAGLFRLLYPLAYEETIRFESQAHGLDAALVAALVRQESSFSPSATSSAGARGLMQVMPNVARRSAAARSARVWSDALLYQPDVSLRLGTAHLASVLARYPEPARALAAYNAGESRVDRWVRKAGTSDGEVFVERIPYVETRDYVRIVLRNLTWYRHLYAL